MGIAKIAETARDRKSKNLPRRRGDGEKERFFAADRR